ncbi:hypothetical protein PTTG_05196 [Puccinia triticina 1-1 BBBD Race 1]|uniref:C2H2-type domain-containing protein n=2 Tax=Puccinia triticina TaxID=208348 RepID=A0A180GRL7_PUCT1|nr:uncharacterized protein PtA15_16A93 [Puccinia triticina]OAV95068.1 hypothetical protein PTTG_05196 [Puccinia triticina 1-1 BBBD Race 1]WAQ92187.1 hypothetical protein PtA15_16A93 [Puccinia triticina]WAR63930.1 hypothetical protein PtB15_16B89 [Puccinia triticina]
MDYLLSQPSLTDYFSEDAQTQEQFDWNLLTSDPSLNVAPPSTISDSGFDPIFTPEQLATLLQTCDSPCPPDLFSQDFTNESLNQSEWNLPPFPDFTVPSVDINNNPFIPSSQPPMTTDSTTYRDGFGNPIPPVDYRPTYDCPTGYETYSSPPAMPSSNYGPSDAYSGYVYPPHPPLPVAARTNHWDLVTSSTYLPSKDLARSDVTSPSAVSEQPIKKHRCQICGRAFQRQTTLTQHLITHTGERPYSCPVAGCGKAFTTASNAKRHAKTHFRISHSFQPY